VQKNKTFYFKGLRMFILRQLNNKINTNVASITVISILLLFTIMILSAAISITNIYNANLEQNNLSDFTLNSQFYAVDGLKTFDVEAVQETEPFQNYVKEFVRYDLYQDDTITLDTLLTPAVKATMPSEVVETLTGQKVSLMKKSEFNRLMELLQQPDLIIETTPQQYVLAVNVSQMINYYQPTLQQQLPLSFQGQTLLPATTTLLNTALYNSSTAKNQGVVIVDDSLLLNAEKVDTKLVGNFYDNPPLEQKQTEEEFTAFIAKQLKNKRTEECLITRQTMEIASVGLGVTVSFI
jgi:putative ABC transport system permease protein